MWGGGWLVGWLWKRHQRNWLATPRALFHKQSYFASDFLNFLVFDLLSLRGSPAVLVLFSWKLLLEFVTGLRTASQ